MNSGDRAGQCDALYTTELYTQKWLRHYILLCTFYHKKKKPGKRKELWRHEKIEETYMWVPPRERGQSQKATHAVIPTI